MDFLYFLQSIRNPVFDFFFDLVTKLGEETVFLAVAIFFFWCVSKREGYYILITGLFGTVINQGLKMLCRIERPWVIDPNFEIVESARLEATGYSFPSGHTQNIAGTFGSIGRYSRRKSVRIICICIILFVAFSRMYLGVHTPLDVVTSLAIAAVLVFGFYPLFLDEKRFNIAMPFIVAIAALISLGLLVYVNCLPNFDELAPSVEASISYVENLVSARENAATLFGCMLGLVVAYPIDRFFTRFTTEGRWYSQIIKLALGLGIVILLKSTLQAPLEAMLRVFNPNPELIARALRYFLIVVFAGVIWPLSFRWFSKLRIPALDSFGERVSSLFSKKQHATGDEDENAN